MGNVATGLAARDSINLGMSTRRITEAATKAAFFSLAHSNKSALAEAALDKVLSF
jgi:hypothetical protein